LTQEPTTITKTQETTSSSTTVTQEPTPPNLETMCDDIDYGE
jgi:hypothetical protein